MGEKGVESIVVEIAGAVEKRGVFKLPQGSRVQDLLILAGGLSPDADRAWVEKHVNLAAKLNDGQKIYIPSKSEQSSQKSAKNNPGEEEHSESVMGSMQTLVNINTASQKELESLPGIGPVYAQKIIEQRPYSSIEELVSKKVLKPSLFEKIKDRISVY